MTAHFPFDNSYARLPDRFFARVAPTPVSAPCLIKLNTALARELNLDPDFLATPEGVEVLSGRQVPDRAEPIALAYAGHQFGNFVPQLGDGRAVLLGEVVDRGGMRRDIQLKGAGPTPFSRQGDGRAALGPVLREYIVSEAMFALGIPTTRSLAAVLTGEDIFRGGPLPGAVLTRVASSHIRVGTFQFFAAQGDIEGVRLLADHVIARHYPEAAQAVKPYHALLEAVVARQAKLVAQWLHVGFIHGVMNTDNCSVAGETIDYGPCAFLDAYDPAKVFSSIDYRGRYAYGNQPQIALWNLSRFAETLLPLLADDETVAVPAAQEILDGFSRVFHGAYGPGLLRKIGLSEFRDGDNALCNDLLTAMAANGADFTLTFRRLGDAVLAPSEPGAVRDLFTDPAAYDAWAARWAERLQADPGAPAERRARMNAVNPAYIPRNHRVEAAIAAAAADDFAPFNELVDVLSRPFDDRSDHARYADPPAVDERVTQTFCGT